MEWCSLPRQQSFLQGGLNFKPETPEDKYALLPAWWHGMTPEEKKKAVAIVDTEGGWTSQVNSPLAPACLALLLKSRYGLLVFG